MEPEALQQEPGSRHGLEGFPVLGRVQAELDDVTRALERLDDGTYGTCQACGGTIDQELLAATPAARACSECR